MSLIFTFVQTPAPLPQPPPPAGGPTHQRRQQVCGVKHNARTPVVLNEACQESPYGLQNAPQTTENSCKVIEEKMQHARTRAHNLPDVEISNDGRVETGARVKRGWGSRLGNRGGREMILRLIRMTLPILNRLNKIKKIRKTFMLFMHFLVQPELVAATYRTLSGHILDSLHGIKFRLLNV